MKRANPIIDTTIAGIPCKVEVTHYFVQKPLGPRADSDLGTATGTPTLSTLCLTVEAIRLHGWQRRWTTGMLNNWKLK